MKKTVLAAVAAALVAGSVASYAAPPVGAGPQGPRPTAEQREVLSDARIAAVKGGLKLTPDQEKLWPAFETALRDVAKQRSALMEQRRAERQAARAAAKQGEKPPMVDPVARLRAGATRMTTTAGEMTKVADALDPLYKALTPEQQKTFQVLARDNLRAFFGGPARPPRPEAPRRG
ncbi:MULTISPECIES: Spy/CpxP family protein refolding chaperone [unclassified Xanthobacter]|uniref:Spy/CpxP family protein refolding chaperone n=1 Tax=unclassified Xanthobacter TaxID=2623496 RepID=UPI001EE04536|nr:MULTISPECIES: Spy/CpxP family protein refolding chaperone [unclassified Xanthobacter]